MKCFSTPARRLCGLLCLAGIFLSPAIFAADVETNSAAILQELKNFREFGTVLYVAAHPDDENTALITYLARGRHYRTGYLSLTRGDGGQNVLGPEFGAELGVIRTEELLAARRRDGGEQFFTRAIDFGFSKDYRETLKIWDHQEVLSDVVRVIRTFQPDVIVAGFSTVPGGTHGHHTASAVLAGEAFKLAGDPKAFPDQLTYLKPWQPKRLLQNVRFGGRGGGGATATGLRIDASGTDPVLGMSYAEIAGRSRAMHKSQGFGNLGGGGGGNGPQYQSFQFLDGEPATNDIMDGIDTTWNRVPGGAEIGKQADEIIAKFDPQKPEASVETLLNLETNLVALCWNLREQRIYASQLADKQRQFNKIVKACLGLSFDTTVSKAEVVPGEKISIRQTVTIQSQVPVAWIGNKLGYPPSERLQPGKQAVREFIATVPEDAQLTEPYWLSAEPSVGLFHVSDAKWYELNQTTQARPYKAIAITNRGSELIGQPENPPPIAADFFFDIKGQTLFFDGEPVQAGTESGNFEARRRLNVIPPVSLEFSSDVKIFAPGSTRQVEIEMTAARANSTGILKLNAPGDWKSVPASQPFQLTSVGDKKKFVFNVTAPEKPASADFTASAEVGGATFNTKRIKIAYQHIPHLLLQPPAKIKAVSLDLAVRGKRIGYVPGAGDSVADAIKQMGCEVTLLNGADLTTNRMKDFDAVVIGVRAFNVRTDLAAHLPDLFSFVESGGNVIAQYNRPGNDLKTDKLAPYNLRISGDRVTDENAAITFLAPDHPALNTPNKITAADFEGWVQERGIYFPNQWDEHFTPILACNDAGESPLKGGLLVAQYGKGYFVYTGLVFFRELPAGVPGAYRLFANLISLGK